jgi:hypothetical protein
VNFSFSRDLLSTFWIGLDEDVIATRRRQVRPTPQIAVPLPATLVFVAWQVPLGEIDAGR